MNAPFFLSRDTVRLAALVESDERARINAFLAAHSDATPFHLPIWLEAAAQGTGNGACAMLAERNGEIAAYLPLNTVHSPLFGRMLASSGFAVGGGLLARDGFDPAPIFAAVEELAQRLSIPAVELRGGLFEQIAEQQ